VSGYARVTGEIDSTGSDTSVDQWYFTHTGGDLEIDVLARGVLSNLDPYIRLFQQDESRWNIMADSGRISALSNGSNTASRIIELLGGVEVYSLDKYGNRTVLTTEFLSLNPVLETLETDQFVTLVTTNLQQTSTGMFADLTIDKIVFHHDNRGSYEKISD